MDFIVKVDWILHREYRILPLSLGVKPNQSVANTEAMAPKVKKMGSTPKWKCLKLDKLVPPSAHDLCIIAIFFLKNGIVPGDSWGLGSQGPERHVAPQKLPLKLWEAPPAQTVPVTERCKYPCSWVSIAKYLGKWDDIPICLGRCFIFVDTWRVILLNPSGWSSGWPNATNTDVPVTGHHQNRTYGKVSDT